MKKTPTKILESITKRGKATVYEICADTTLTYAYVAWNLRVLQAQNLVAKSISAGDCRQHIWRIQGGETA